jgi:hypothetical protein
MRNEINSIVVGSWRVAFFYLSFSIYPGSVPSLAFIPDAEKLPWRAKAGYYRAREIAISRIGKGNLSEFIL